MTLGRLFAQGCAALLILVLTGAGPALAQEDDTNFLSFGAGYYDIVSNDDGAADFRLEYRHGKGLWWLKPWAGVEVTSDGGVWGGGGLLLDIPLGANFALVPSAGVGAYENGSGKDLGSALEFRTQIELAYRFEDRSRLALQFSHISNAGIGKENPGVEILGAYYHLPLDKLF